MTDNTNITTSRVDDEEELRRIYRCQAPEAAPSHLDQVVLQKASAELRSTKALYGLPAWFRPAAFAATVLLSFSILLQLNDSGYLDLNVFPEPAVDVASDDGDKSSTTLQKLTNEAEQSSSRIREIGQTASHRSLGEDENPGDSRALAERNVSDDDLANCPGAWKDSLESWLACIDKLRTDGRLEAADDNLQQLLVIYPDYVAEPAP